ncbi:MAG TPA: LysM peptidoglycan-binding domain-containing protein [Verrucomicrobiales bacterium]|nr:LysM peptidoglycan-binding domain-containing protein [Verrucomicrobiales bacterium]HIL69856.1 LysM peptidoglycan-binding domain-containing protein [Verrucomicrobiota bacterium]
MKPQFLLSTVSFLLLSVGTPLFSPLEAADQSMVLRLQNQNKVLTGRVLGLSGDLRILQDDQVALKKQINDLTRQVNSLTNRLKTVERKATSNQSGNYVTQEQYQSLLKSIREVDSNRVKDQQLILNTLRKLGSNVKGRGTASLNSPGKKPRLAQIDPSKYKAFYDYPVESGNTLTTIAAAYRKSGVPVKVADILAANPGLDPKKLQVGKTIKIPHPK